MFYVTAWENYASVYRKEPMEYTPGRVFGGGGHTPVTPVPGAPVVRIGRTNPINSWTDVVGHGAVIAIDPRTGQPKWKLDQFDVSDSGILTTGSDLLFTGLFVLFINLSPRFSFARNHRAEPVARYS